MTDSLHEPAGPLYGHQIIGSPSLLTEEYIEGVTDEVLENGYLDTLLELSPEQRLEELRHYAELVDSAQLRTWRLAADLVAKNATRDKLLHPDLYSPVLYFEAASLAMDDEFFVPYYVQLTVVPLQDHEADYDELRDILYDLDKPGFCERSELIAAIPGISIQFRFYEATTVTYSPEEHSGSHYISLDGKIAKQRPELDFTISNVRPGISAEVLDELDESDEEVYMLALTSLLVDIKVKMGVFAYYTELLEQMHVRHMLYPDLDYVQGDE